MLHKMQTSIFKLFKSISFAQYISFLEQLVCIHIESKYFSSLFYRKYTIYKIAFSFREEEATLISGLEMNNEMNVIWFRIIHRKREWESKIQIWIEIYWIAFHKSWIYVRLYLCVKTYENIASEKCWITIIFHLDGV